VASDTVYVALDNEVWRFHQPVGSEPAGEQLFTSSSGFVFYDIHASNSKWILAAGASGTIAWYDGSGWTEQSLGTLPLTCAKTSYSLGIKVAVVAGYSGSLYVYDGSWTQGSLATGEDLQDISGVSGPSGALYGIRDGRLYRFQSFPVQWNPAMALPSVDLTAIYCTGENQVWAVGDPSDPMGIDRYAHFYDGWLWTSYWLSSDSDCNDLWCQDIERVCIVGDNGSVWYRSYFPPPTPGWVFTPVQAVTPPQDLHGVWGFSVTDLYTVGDNGTIAGSADSGAHWTSMVSPVTTHLRDVWGWAPDSVVAVGDGGTVLLYQGSGWTVMATGVSQDLQSVWCSGPGDIWVAGYGTLVIHWNGSAWERFDTALPVAPIRKIRGWGSDVWFACDKDYLLMYQEPIW
jgi:hypothetical protein